MNTLLLLGSGSLTSIVANLRGDLKSITTRSGITYDGSQIPPPLSPLPKVMEWETEVTKDTVQPSTENIQPTVVQIQAPIDEPVVALKPKPSIPYPSRANKEKLCEKDDNLASKFVKIFRELHFELSFADALLHMPKFAFNAVILKKLPEKLGDPSKFLIPCDFLEIVEFLALDDLGASINLMPLSIWKKLSLPELTPTQMILELTDRSTTSPSVVDYVVDPRVPLILGRPFLRMTCALIDVYDEELTLRVDDEAITFKVGQTLRYSYNDAVLINRIDVIDIACEEIDDEDFDPEGDLLLLEKLLNDDPSSPLLLKELMFDDLKEDEKILIDPQDQEKTTFTCPYGTFAYRRMSFGLCNAPGTFQRCIMAIFHDMIEETMECEDNNLVLNEEKCHFMLKEGIVLGHKISKSGIEFDKAKVDVIAKLPHPTSVKGI
ncbi:hypothetical protein Tco_0925255 [Tanacetum coccineum]|uniref:Reverse transcriptase domain-containing protein n=1 Tax=Tanacetum coccineum TaxID=301880 RepID=A0ABQ5D6B0_9ASTR